MLDLYELTGLQDRRYSLFSWRARLAIAHKALTPNCIAVRITDKASIAFSGQEKVPILVDRDMVVCDSWRIAEYLEKTYPERPSLFGGGIGQGVARFINAWVDRQVIPAAAPLILGDLVNHLEQADAEHLRLQMEGAFRTTIASMRENREAQLKVLRKVLDPARVTFKQQAFLAGEAPAYADYILFSVFQWGRVAGSAPLLEAGDLLTTWFERISDLFNGQARAAVPE